MKIISPTAKERRNDAIIAVIFFAMFTPFLVLAPQEQTDLTMNVLIVCLMHVQIVRIIAWLVMKGGQNETAK